MELGCDCVGTIQYWDALLTNAKGEWIERTNFSSLPYVLMCMPECMH